MDWCFRNANSHSPSQVVYPLFLTGDGENPSKSSSLSEPEKAFPFQIICSFRTWFFSFPLPNSFSLRTWKGCSLSFRTWKRYFSRQIIFSFRTWRVASATRRVSSVPPPPPPPSTSHNSSHRVNLCGELASPFALFSRSALPNKSSMGNLCGKSNGDDKILQINPSFILLQFFNNLTILSVPAFITWVVVHYQLLFVFPLPSSLIKFIHLQLHP